MIYSAEIRITAPVEDTEIEARVVDAITNLFPGAEVTNVDGEVYAETHTMEHFSELLHRRAILDTARTEFFKTLTDDTFSFSVKKQAAFEGFVNFAIGEPGELGDIHVHVRVDDPDAESFIDYVAPPTEDGRPITDDS